MHPCLTEGCSEFLEGRKKFCTECKRKKHNAQDSSRYMATRVTMKDLMRMKDEEYPIHNERIVRMMQREAV